MLLSLKRSPTISMRSSSAIKLLNCKALQPPRGLNHGRTSRGAYDRAMVQNVANDIEAAR
ncbi:hypothetical protein PHPALM_31698 [Phytophthora palmivora]|uniref:Uncharacterized protein n=1 Tax=Phytophthora palmivora TaxID=4796 RepID=A0A2P4X1W9_9STRA|nr:hypothetical protein PHPALM_31698 [Phytophthora palmivora]